MPNLNEFEEEAERRQIAEQELFDSEDDEIMPKADKPARAAIRATPYQKEKARREKEIADAAEKTRKQNDSRADRAANRAGRKKDLEAASQARETAPQADPADDARHMDAASQEQITRDNAARDERPASTVSDTQMDLDADIAAQIDAEMAAANRRAQEARPYSPDIDEPAIQEELDRQLQAEQIARDNAARDERPASTVSDTQMDLDADIAAQIDAEMAAANRRAQAARPYSPDIDEPAIQEELDRQLQTEMTTSAASRAPARADNLRLQELEAENEALRQVAENANQERLDAISGRMAEAERANDAIAANQRLAEQLLQSNSDRDLAVKRAQDLEARQSELQRQSDSAVAMGKTSIEAANRASQDADARAKQLEALNQNLRRERDEAVNSVGQRDQQLAQANALTKSLTETKQTADLQIAELNRRNAEQVKRAAQATASATAEQANREAAERELAKRGAELRTSKENLAAEKAARQQADATIADLSGKLKAANEAAAREKAGRETAEYEASNQKKLVGQLSGEGDKAKALEAARRDAEAKIRDLEGKLQSANELAAREKAGHEMAETTGRAATEEARREKVAREAAEKNAQELITRNDQLTIQAKEATQARVQAEEKMKALSDRKGLDGDPELRKQLAQEKAERQIAETKLAATTGRIDRLEAELNAMRENPDPDKPIHRIKNEETGKDASRAATAVKEEGFGMDDIDDADFDAAIAAAEAKQKEAAMVKAKADEFGMDDISDEDFDAAVAAAEAKQTEVATAAKAAEASRTTPAPAVREGSPALDPAHTVKGNVWYRAGKIYVPEQQYDKMLDAGVMVDKEVEKGQTKKVPLEAAKSAREALLQAPNGDLHSPRVYKNVHGAAAFEARAKAEGLDPKLAAKWAAKDRTRPQTLVRMKNGNLVDGKSLEIAAGRAGLANKFGERNVFVENQTTRFKDGQEIITGTGNYRRADNAIEHARSAGGVVRLSQRLETMHVSPQPESRDSNVAAPPSNLSNGSPSTRRTTPERATLSTSDRKPIYRNGQVVASVPANGKNGGIKRLNDNQRTASAEPRQNNQSGNRNYRGSQPSGHQSGAHNRQTSPTTTINLTVNGAVGHGTATPNVTANAAPQTKYSPKLDDRPRTQNPLGRN